MTKGVVGRLTGWGCRVGRLGSIAVHAHAASAVAPLGGAPHSHLKGAHLRHMADQDSCWMALDKVQHESAATDLLSASFQGPPGACAIGTDGCYIPVYRQV